MIDLHEFRDAMGRVEDASARLFEVRDELYRLERPLEDAIDDFEACANEFLDALGDAQMLLTGWRDEAAE